MRKKLAEEMGTDRIEGGTALSLELSVPSLLEPREKDSQPVQSSRPNTFSNAAQSRISTDLNAMISASLWPK